MKTHVLFLSCLVNVIEKHCVVVADIPGTFLSADWPDDAPECYIKFEGTMVDMICQINPKYENCIKYTKHGKK